MRLIEASVEKAIRSVPVWDLLGYPGVWEPLESQTTGCHQKQQMFKSLYLMKTGSTHFLAVFPQ